MPLFSSLPLFWRRKSLSSSNSMMQGTGSEHTPSVLVHGGVVSTSSLLKLHDENNNNESGQWTIIRAESQRGIKRSLPEDQEDHTHRMIKKKTSCDKFLSPAEKLEMIYNVIARRIKELPVDENQEENGCFYGQGVLDISMEKYVERLIHWTNKLFEDEEEENDLQDSTGVRCAIIALELLQKHQVKIAKKSIHRIFAMAFFSGLKSTEDYFVANTTWAKIAGVSGGLDEINAMEIAFLARCKWNVLISEQEYFSQKKTMKI